MGNQWQIIAVQIDFDIQTQGTKGTWQKILANKFQKRKFGKNGQSRF